jgi:hypothetical protein
MRRRDTITITIGSCWRGLNCEDRVESIIDLTMRTAALMSNDISFSCNMRGTFYLL